MIRIDGDSGIREIDGMIGMEKGIEGRSKHICIMHSSTRPALFTRPPRV
jgi:hypothetical protein